MFELSAISELKHVSENLSIQTIKGSIVHCMEFQRSKRKREIYSLIHRREVVYRSSLAKY